VIYFDHNATTPPDERVLEAMAPYLGKFFGNPSGLYRLARLSRSAIDTAREQVAALVGALPSQVIFSSCGTEANNLAIKGLAFGMAPGKCLYGATEHPSVTGPMEFLGRRGWDVSVLSVDRAGRLSPEAAGGRHVGVRFASVMLANNETGVIQDLKPLGETLRERGAYLHCDAVQACGKIPVEFAASGVDLMSLSSHKINGPKGAGALVRSQSVTLEPLLHGGGQESDLRGGTENVAAIVGFGKAAELALSELAQRRSLTRSLREALERGLKALPGMTLFADEAERLPNTLQFGMAGIDGETLVMALDRAGIAVSSGSACASGAGEPSPVLLAMGVSPQLAKSAVRVSLGSSNTMGEVDEFLSSTARIAREFAEAA
jgi:cysteine desulfurase